MTPRKAGQAAPPAIPPPQPADAKRTGPGLLGRLRTARRGVVVLTASLLGLLALYAAALYVLRPDSAGRQVRLDEVVQAGTEGRVPQVRFLDEDARVIGVMIVGDGGRMRFWASYPRSDAATNELFRTFLAADTEVTVDSQSAKALIRFLAQFLMPLVILANLFALLFYLVRGGTGGTDDFLKFGQIGDRRDGSKGRTTFADVAASDEQLVELTEIRDYLADPAAFARMGAQPPKGILLVGPPGCATSSARPVTPPPPSSSSTSSTPSAASGGRGWAAATTSGSRPSTSCSSRWTASPPPTGWRCWPPPTG